MKTTIHADNTTDTASDYLSYDAAIKRGMHPALPCSNGSETSVELDADVEATAGRH